MTTRTYKGAELLKTFKVFQAHRPATTMNRIRGLALTKAHKQVVWNLLRKLNIPIKQAQLEWIDHEFTEDGSIYTFDLIKFN